MEFMRLAGGFSDGLDTHRTSYFQTVWKSLSKYCKIPLSIVCDPFARNCSIAHPHTNDIDEGTTARHHLDAVEFLQTRPSQYFDLVIFDPPFSPRQSEQKSGGHKNVYSTPGYVPLVMAEIERIMKPGGYMLKFGYNSTRHSGSFELVRGWVANQGGNRNDVIITLWRNCQTRLNI